MIMNTSEPQDKIQPKFTYIQCPNCSGYGSKGFNKITCPSCLGKGVLEVPIKEEENGE